MGLCDFFQRIALTMLSVMVGVYAVMFKAFDLARGFDVFGWAARFGLSADVANGFAAAVFVFGLGFLVYGVSGSDRGGPYYKLKQAHTKRGRHDRTVAD